MTLSDNIDTISTALDNIHDAIVARGVTPTGNITTYADAIEDISANKYGVSIDTLLGDVDTNGVLQAPQVAGDFICNARSISPNTSFQSKFINTNITSFKMPLLESTGDSTFNNCCNGCSNLTEVDFSSLTVASSQSFTKAFLYTGATSFSFPELTTIEGLRTFHSAFDHSKGITFNFTKLVRIGSSSASSIDSGHFANAFSYLGYEAGSYVTNLSLTFPELTSIYCTGSSGSDGTFAENNSLQKLYFPKLNTITHGSGAASYNKAAAKNIFYNCPNLTEIHFALDNQAAIEATAGYSTKWGAANATIYFDL